MYLCTVYKCMMTYDQYIFLWYCRPIERASLAIVLRDVTRFTFIYRLPWYSKSSASLSIPC